MRSAGLAIALLLAGSLPAASADAIAAYGEFYVRATVIAKCQTSQDAGAPAFPRTGEALQHAALEEFWAEIDAVNPTHHEENGLRAEELLQQERERRDAQIEAQIRSGACTVLRRQMPAPPVPGDHSL